MKIVRDIVATVTGAASYQICRLLIDEEHNAAVFIPDQDSPVLTFKANSASVVGSGTLPDGSVVGYKQRGASCSYKLAKCNVKSMTLATRWANSLV